MGLLSLLWFLLVPFPVILGIYLAWRQTGVLRILGWLLLLLVAYYRLSWVSPRYVLGGSNLVQEFNLGKGPFGPFPTVRWIENSNRLLLIPDENVIFRPEPPEYNHVLVVDLETKQAHWQPKAQVDLDKAIPIKYLPTGSPRLGTQSEFIFVGFSLPILVYDVPWPFFRFGNYWRWEKTYFGVVRDIVRESESGPGVVELNQVVFNAPWWRVGSSSRWVMEGKYSIVEPEFSTDPRVLVLGPFNTSQHTQSENNQHKE